MKRVTYAGEWTPYIIKAPNNDWLVRFWNEYNDQVWTGYSRDLRPEFNVAYLWWKKTGIQLVLEELSSRRSIPFRAASDARSGKPKGGAGR